MPTEQAITFRQPSTANFLIDSVDRTDGDRASNFSITKTANLFTGFFNRIGVSEVVLEWAVPNVTTDNSLNVVQIDVSGLGVKTFYVPQNNYSIADYLDTVVNYFNALPGLAGQTLAVSSTGGVCSLTMTGGAFRIPLGPSALTEIGFPLGGAYVTSRSTVTGNDQGTQPNARAFGYSTRYLDFVCSQLTYNQELKDASTAPIVRDVLCRFYMDYTNDIMPYDKYGFPIYMGMKPNAIRRIFSPPKQIRWSNLQPLGQVIFQVFDSNENLVREGFEWLMTLQVSED